MKLPFINVINYISKRRLKRFVESLYIFEMILYRVAKNMIHFSIGNIFVNPRDTAKQNISLDT